MHKFMRTIGFGGCHIDAESGCIFVEQTYLFCDDQFFRIRERCDPVAEGVPLGELMILSRVIDVHESLIVHRAGAHLVVAGREKLDHVVPVLLIFSFVHVFQTDLLKAVYNGLHVSESVRSHMVMAEIIDVERL